MTRRVVGLASAVFLVCLAFRLVPGVIVRAESQQDPLQLLQSVARFDAADLRELRAGEAVVNLMPSDFPGDLFVIGAIHIRGNPADYVKFASNIEALGKNSQYLAIGHIRQPPRPEDFTGFDVSAEELQDLLQCKPGDCDYQVPEGALEEFRKSLDGTSPELRITAAQKLREMAAHRVRQYQQFGNAALGTYIDKKRRVQIGEQFADLVSKVTGLREYMPGLNRHLLEYPNYQISGARNAFYWEEVEFGLKPTFRINHMTSYSDAGAHVVAIKQIYASHYFQVALDISVCAPAKDGGFYLINWRGSRQDGLSGFRGSILRKVVSAKVREGQIRVLAAAKRRLEVH